MRWQSIKWIPLNSVGQWLSCIWLWSLAHLTNHLPEKPARLSVSGELPFRKNHNRLSTTDDIMPGPDGCPVYGQVVWKWISLWNRKSNRLVINFFLCRFMGVLLSLYLSRSVLRSAKKTIDHKIMDIPYWFAKTPFIWAYIKFITSRSGTPFTANWMTDL